MYKRQVYNHAIKHERRFERMNVEIADRLLKLRKKNGFSQEELAEKLGISRQAVSKCERAEASPDTDNLIRLAKLYGYVYKRQGGGVSLRKLDRCRRFFDGGPADCP